MTSYGDEVADDETKAQAVRLYTTTTLTVTQIARRLGIARPTLYQWLRNAGVTLRSDLDMDETTDTRSSAAGPPLLLVEALTRLAALEQDVSSLREACARIEGLLLGRAQNGI